MSEYRFTVIVAAPPMSHDETDALAAAGCTDASIRSHADGFELLFERSGDSLQSAIESAIKDVEQAGYAVSKVELQREMIGL